RQTGKDRETLLALCVPANDENRSEPRREAADVLVEGRDSCYKFKLADRSRRIESTLGHHEDPRSVTQLFDVLQDLPPPRAARNRADRGGDTPRGPRRAADRSSSRAG